MKPELLASHVIVAEGLSKVYQDGSKTLRVIEALDLWIARGEMLAITGASGIGKSTLLHILGGLDSPSGGQVWVNGQLLSRLSDRQRCQLRSCYLGFVYQFHHLLPEFNVLENVALPRLIQGGAIQEAKERAELLLLKVGLKHRLNFRVGQLSGGEKQRVAIARALVTDPGCVLADEPTGNCDEKTAHALFELMLSLNQEMGTSFVIVTHDTNLASKMHRQMLLRNGKLTEKQAT